MLHHARSATNFSTTRRLASENEVPEVEPHPRQNVSELSLYVVTFVHLILSYGETLLQNTTSPRRSVAQKVMIHRNHR